MLHENYSPALKTFHKGAHFPSLLSGPAQRPGSQLSWPWLAHSPLTCSPNHQGSFKTENKSACRPSGESQGVGNGYYRVLEAAQGISLLSPAGGPLPEAKSCSGRKLRRWCSHLDVWFEEGIYVFQPQPATRPCLSLITVMGVCLLTC